MPFTGRKVISGKPIWRVLLFGVPFISNSQQLDGQFGQSRASMKQWNTIWLLFNSSPWKIPYKWRFIAGKIIYKWAMASMAMLNNQRVLWISYIGQPILRFLCKGTNQCNLPAKRRFFGCKVLILKLRCLTDWMDRLNGQGRCQATTKPARICVFVHSKVWKGQVSVCNILGRYMISLSRVRFD